MYLSQARLTSVESEFTLKGPFNNAALSYLLTIDFQMLSL